MHRNSSLSPPSLTTYCSAPRGDGRAYARAQRHGLASGVQRSDAGEHDVCLRGIFQDVRRGPPVRLDVAVRDGISAEGQSLARRVHRLRKHTAVARGEMFIIIDMFDDDSAVHSLASPRASRPYTL